MKTFILACAIAVLSAAASTQTLADDVYVQGYFKSNGTYVQPHYRTSPDSNPFNNYSTQGNTNPYTGRRGNADPYGSGSIYEPYQPPSRGSSYGEPLGGYPSLFGN